MNSAGTVVGYAGSPVHATQWGAAGAIDLGTLGGDQSFAEGINAAGDVVGYSSVSGCCDYHATVWRSGVATDLNDLVDASVRDAGWSLWPRRPSTASVTSPAARGTRCRA